MTIAPPTLTRTRGKTLFITFYSFKGGVGRTMSLVNAACILAARGRRVLMIDFDLEAPGLTTLKDLTSGGKTPEQHPGLVELIHDFLRDPTASALADTANKTRFRNEYVCPLEIPAHLERIDGGSLDLMPCGRMDNDYGKRLNAIKFDQIYEAGVGQPLFKLLKRVIQQSGLYDYVLIDSRTGFSDEGGICTRDLADHIFVVMGLNRQNVDGTVRFLHSLKRSGWQEGRVLFIVSPMPLFYEELRDERLASACKQIEATGYKTDLKLHVPYHPRLSLDEEPFVYHWSETNLFDAYQRIYSQIRTLNNDTPVRLSEEAIKAVRELQIDQAILLLNQIRLESTELAVNLLSFITDQIADDMPALQRHLAPFFELWIKIVGEELYVLLRYETVLRHTGEFTLAEEISKRVLQIAIEQKNSLYIAHAQLALGNIRYDQCAYQDALTFVQAALIGYTDAEYENGIADAKELVGHIHEAIANRSESIHYYSEAQKIYERLQLTHSATWSRFFISSSYINLGKYDEAELILGEVLTQFRKLKEDTSVAAAQHNLGYIMFLRGDNHNALKLYRKALAAFTKVQAQSYKAGVQSDIAEMHQAEGDHQSALKLLEATSKIYNEYNQKIDVLSVQGEIGRSKIFVGDIVTGRQLIEEANMAFEQLGNLSLLAEGQVDYAEVLFHTAMYQEAFSYLDQHWQTIQEYAAANVKMEAHVLRAKIRIALGSTADVKADLQVALDFYTAQKVHNHLAKEAAELAASLSADI